MDIRKHVAQIAAGEWAGIDDAEETLKAFNEAQEREETEQRAIEARIVKRALATPDGHVFLGWLARKTVLRPPNGIELSAATADAYAIAKAKREGQNSIYFTIMEALGDTSATKESDA